MLVCHGKGIPQGDGSTIDEKGRVRIYCITVFIPANPEELWKIGRSRILCHV